MPNVQIQAAPAPVQQAPASPFAPNASSSRSPALPLTAQIAQQTARAAPVANVFAPPQIVAPVGLPVPNLRVLQYNIDMALREEDYDNTKWTNRCARVRAVLEQSNADVICLQELRTLPVDGQAQTPEQFLSSIKGYRFCLEYRSPNPLSFGQAILYKADRFFALSTCKRWLSDTPTVFSESWPSDSALPHLRTSIVSGVHLAVMNKDDVLAGALDSAVSSFWVFTTHYNLAEYVKTRSCHATIEIVKSLTSADNTPWVLTGDLNFFPDGDGDTQRALLTSAGFRDLGQKAVTSQGGVPLDATFVGFEHDLHRKPSPFTSASRLDHIFASAPFEVVSNPILITNTMNPQLDGAIAELSSPNSLPSDHLPLLVEIGMPVPSNPIVADTFAQSSTPVCDICSMNPLNRTIVPCGHAICDGCAEQWFATKNHCPFCRTDKMMVIPRYSN